MGWDGALRRPRYRFIGRAAVLRRPIFALELSLKAKSSLMSFAVTLARTPLF